MAWVEDFSWDCIRVQGCLTSPQPPLTSPPLTVLIYTEHTPQDHTPSFPRSASQEVTYNPVLII